MEEYSNHVWELIMNEEGGIGEEIYTKVFQIRDELGGSSEVKAEERPVKMETDA